MENLLFLSTSENTRQSYSIAVRAFHSFVRDWKLERKSFQEQVLLFVTLLSVCDKAPQMISSYVSAIKADYKLQTPGNLSGNEFLLSRVLRGCWVMNRGPRLQHWPIMPQMLPIIICNLAATVSPYNKKLYPAVVTLMFHALLRVGEVTHSKHNLPQKGVSILARHLGTRNTLNQLITEI